MSIHSLNRIFAPVAAALLVSLLVGCGGDGNGTDQSLNSDALDGGFWIDGVNVVGGIGNGGRDGGSNDLTVAAVVAPNVIFTGSAALLDFTVSNQGLTTSPLNVPWRLYRQQGKAMVQVDHGTLDKISAGGAESVSATLDTDGLPLGDVVLCFVIDPDDLVSESDETNNEQEVVVEIVPGGNG